MKLSGEDKEKLCAAMLSAFPDYNRLQRMVSFKLNENLQAIAGTGNLQDVIFNLIKWAESKSCLKELVIKAREDNGGNEELKEFFEFFLFKYSDKKGSPDTTEETASRDKPCPYRGLSAFQPEDKELFFGRKKFTEKLLKAVQTEPLVTIIGASGSGKSSVVFAGLIPCLEQDWQVAHFRPDKCPFDALATALLSMQQAQMGADGEQQPQDSEIKKAEINHVAEKLQQNDKALQKVIESIVTSSSKCLLLVADQFEELYTLCPDADERERFIDSLLSAVKDVPSFRLVLTLRSDFYGYAQSYRPFNDALEGNCLNLGAMNREELREVIESPASSCGITLEAGLIEQILNDIGKKPDKEADNYEHKSPPDKLPLLEFALKQLWKKARDDRTNQLTNQAYDKIGGLEQALSQYAEEVYSQKLTEDEREQLKKVFIQLVTPGEVTGTENTRRIATRQQVKEENWDLVTRLNCEDVRLVVIGYNKATSEETVELVHEVLITGWGRLNHWMNDNRVFRTWQERLRAAVRLWENNQKKEGYLLQGAPLGEAEGWLEKRREELSSTEQEFIALSKDEKQRRELKELEAQVALDTATERNQILAEANQERDRRIRRGNITLRLTSVLAFLVITLTSIYALQKFREAQEAQEGTKLEQAGVNALRQMPSGEIEALLSAIQAGQKLKPLIQDGRLPKDYPATSPLLALQKILDTIHQQNQINAGQGGIRSVRFSPDGQTIATAGEDDTISLWSLSGEKKWTRKGVQLGVADSVKTMSFVAFSPDGKKIVAAEGDGTITLWDLSGKQLTQFKARTTNFKSLSFSPDGKKIATADEETARLWDLSGKQLAQFVGHKGRVNSIGFSPTSQQIATAGYDGTVRLWDLLGKQLTQFKAHNGQEILSLSFSPDGKYLATAAKDNTARIWNLSGQEQVKLEGHQGWVLNVSFSHDGKRLATTSDDGTARIWNFSGKLIATLQGHRGAVSSASFSPDKQYLVTGGNDDTARIWNLSQKSPKQFTGHQSDVNSISFSPTGQQVVTADHQGKVILWNQFGQRQSQWRADLKGPLWSVSFSPDGQLIATGGFDNTVAIWDLSGKLKARLEDHGHKSWISSISFSPNGQMILTSGADNTAKLWNLSGKLLATLKGHQGVVSRFSPDGQMIATGAVVSRFSPDGQMIATGAWDGTIRLWDLSGHQVKQWQTKQRQISGLSFSSSGKQLATADKSGVVKIWELSGKQQLEFFSYQSGVNSLSFSPKGNYLATGGMDGTARLWDSQGRQIAEFNTKEGAVFDISFSPDGKSIIAGGRNGIVQLWQIKRLDKLLAQGCQWLQYYQKSNKEKMKDLNVCR